MLFHVISTLCSNIWLSSVSGGGDFEPCLGGMENLNRNFQVFLFFLAEWTRYIF